jgi:ribosomal protein S18
MKKQDTNFGNMTAKVSRISWAAILAGTLTALAVVSMLNLLGLGIGFSTIDPMTENDPLSGLGTGALIWLGLSNLAALFVGGMVAGRMSGYPSKSDGGLHGFLSWALFALVSFYLITTAVGTMVNGLSSAVSSVFCGSQNDRVKVILDKAEEKGEDNTTLSYENIKKEAFQLINKAEKYNILPDDASENARQPVNEAEKDVEQAFNDLNLDENIDEFLNNLSFDIDDNKDLQINVDGEVDFFDKEELKNYLAENTELDEAEINGLINKWNKNIEIAVDKAEMYYAKAKQKAIKYSDKAAEAVATASIAAFIIFFLGALAAFFGGATGSPLLTVSEERREEKFD